jgi:thiamine pyrophosphate-dependent acetolactate synthase large subunit-like protein
MTHHRDNPSVAMPVVAALQVLIDLRDSDQLIVTNQASARIWPRLSRHPLDFHYNPSTMGGAIPLAVGLAMAQPRRQVLVVSGDGALLMNLGSLVTVSGTGITNLTIVVLENRLYEVTGGQKTPAAGTAVDFAGLARAAGFPTVESFHDLTDWQSRAMKTLSFPGPRFISLEVEPTPSEFLKFATPPVAEQLAALQEALKIVPAAEVKR